MSFVTWSRLFSLAMSFATATLSLEATEPDPLHSTNWAQWRGPLHNGHAPTANPPLEWSESKNVKWKVELPGAGSSTPIVWENQIFILTAIPTNREGPAVDAQAVGNGAPTKIYQFVVLCLDRATGIEIWRRVAIEQMPHESKHATNTYASASPVTDGKHIIASFGSRGIYCLDMTGQPVWHRDLGDMRTRNGFGEGSSPALHGDSLVVVWDEEDSSFIEVLDKNNGKTKWKQPRSEPTTWSTPLVVEHNGKTQIVTTGTNRVRSYDLANGQLLWECGGQVTNPIPCPIRVDDHVVCMTGYRGYAVYSLPLEAKGDLTDSERIKWKRTNSAPYVSSAVLYGGQLYYTKSMDAILSITDANTGQAIIEQTRLPIPDLFYASPVAAKDRIYFTGRNGATIVLRHGRTLDVLATNQLNEGIDASPALVANQIFLRGEKHLYCIQE